MANTIGVFWCDSDANGVTVGAGGQRLIGGCLSVEEIDTNIRLLKEDLDAVAIKMKTALVELKKRPLFGPKL